MVFGGFFCFCFVFYDYQNHVAKHIGIFHLWNSAFAWFDLGSGGLKTFEILG